MTTSPAAVIALLEGTLDQLKQSPLLAKNVPEYLTLATRLMEHEQRATLNVNLARILTVLEATNKTLTEALVFLMTERLRERTERPDPAQATHIPPEGATASSPAPKPAKRRP